MQQSRREMLTSILNDGVERTISEIVEELPIGYFHNSHKYIGEVLKRMVKCGMVTKVKRGTYKFKSYVPAKEKKINKLQQEIKW